MKNKIVISLSTILLLALFTLNSFSLSAQNDPKKEKPLIVTLSSSNYSDETKEGLVFVDFWASWCGPCRKMAPILEQVAEENKDVLKIGKVNVDNYKKFAVDMGIEVLPTIVVYKDGEEVGRLKGLVSKSVLEEVIEKYGVKKAG